MTKIATIVIYAFGADIPPEVRTIAFSFRGNLADGQASSVSAGRLKLESRAIECLQRVKPAHKTQNNRAQHSLQDQSNGSSVLLDSWPGVQTMISRPGDLSGAPVTAWRSDTMPGVNRSGRAFVTVDLYQPLLLDMDICCE